MFNRLRNLISYTATVSNHLNQPHGGGLTALGLTDWIAETQEQYVELAVQKASDLQSLAALRRQLRSIFTSSVMGAPVAYARAVEQEYRQLWREWCAGVSSNGREYI